MTRIPRPLAIPGRASWVLPLLRLFERRQPRIDRSSLSPHLLRDMGLYDAALDAGPKADWSRQAPLAANWWER